MEDPFDVGPKKEFVPSVKLDLDARQNALAIGLGSMVVITTLVYTFAAARSFMAFVAMAACTPPARQVHNLCIVYLVHAALI